MMNAPETASRLAGLVFITYRIIALIRWAARMGSMTSLGPVSLNFLV